MPVIVSDVEMKENIKKLLENTFLDVGPFYYFYYLYFEYGQVKEKTVRFRFGEYEANKDRAPTEAESEIKKILTDAIVEVIRDIVEETDKIRVIVRFNNCFTDVSIKDESDV